MSYHATSLATSILCHTSGGHCSSCSREAASLALMGFTCRRYRHLPHICIPQIDACRTPVCINTCIPSAYFHTLTFVHLHTVIAFRVMHRYIDTYVCSYICMYIHPCACMNKKVHRRERIDTIGDWCTRHSADLLHCLRAHIYIYIYTHNIVYVSVLICMCVDTYMSVVFVYDTCTILYLALCL